MKFSGRLVCFLLIIIFTCSQLAGPSGAMAAGRSGGHSAIMDPMGNSASQDPDSRLATMEKAIEATRKELGIPGLSLAIVKDGAVIYMKGFGLRNIERRTPVTPDTLFPIGSTTKAFTALTAMMSVDEGKLSLEDSPKKFLPYFSLMDPEANQHITIRDLLCHRTGVRGTDLALGTPALSREEVIRVAGLSKPTAKFREQFQYNNTLFSAAGEAIAKAQNSTWEKLIAQRIFKPLGMRESNTSTLDLQKSHDFSTGYMLLEETGRPMKLPVRNLSNVAPAGAINSNVRDMAQWLRLMLNGGVFNGERLVSEKSFKELFSKQMDMTGGLYYGLGWVLFKWRGYDLVSHDGGIDGYHAVVEMIPDHHVGYVLLANVDEAALEKNVRKIVWANVVGLPDQGSPNGPTASQGASNNSSTAQDHAALNELAGTYQAEGDDAFAEVTAKDGQLSLLISGQPPFTLVATGKDQFKITGLPPTYFVKVERDASGHVSGLLLKEPDDSTEFKRAVEFVPPLSVEQLMSKMTSALGGEANLRRHKTMLTTFETNFENIGMKGSGRISSKAPYAKTTNLDLMALGKKIGTIKDYFDGSKGGILTDFGPPLIRSGTELDDARINSDFYQQVLDWKKLFNSISIKRISRVKDEDVFVVVKTPLKGNPVTDYVSTKSFLVLKRETIEAGDDGESNVATEVYKDFRQVDRVLMPFEIVQQSSEFGNAVTHVKDVKFNVSIPNSVFLAGPGR